MPRLFLTLACTVLVSACSGTAAPPAAAPSPAPPAVSEPTLDPVGVYDFSTDVEGQTVTGTMTITGTPGAYSGSISSDIGGLTLRDITVDGMELSFVGDMPDATVYFVLVFDGDSISGEWDAEGMVGFISGKKR